MLVMKKYKWQIVYGLMFLLSIAISIMYAIGNGFPLLFSDTGTYIYTGMRWILPNDRPAMYGMLIWLFSFRFSLWLVVIAQAAVINYLIFLFIKNVTGNTRLTFFLLPVMILFLSSLTQFSFFVTFLTPDIFSAVAIFGSLLIVAFPEMQKGHRIAVFIITVIAVLTHYSNFVNILSILLGLSILFLILRKKQWIKVRKKVLLIMLMLVVVSYASNYTTNRLYGSKDKVSKASFGHPFATMLESGLVHEYLREHCSDSSFFFCKYIDRLPFSHGTFLWDFENSPLYFDCDSARNCLLEKNEEMGKILMGMMKDPCYLQRMLLFSAERTNNQLFHFDLISVPGYREEFPVRWMVRKYFPADMPDFVNSGQFNCGFNIGMHNRTIRWFIYTCLFLLIVFFSIPVFYRRITWSVKLFFWLFLVAMLSNAFVCSVLSSGTSRYQGRIVWMIPLIAMVILVSLVADYYRRKKQAGPGKRI